MAPTQIPNEAERCTICLDTMINPTITICGHKFCSDCIKVWLEANNTCPICRARLPDGHVPEAEYYEYTEEEIERAARDYQGARRDSLLIRRDTLGGLALDDLSADLRRSDDVMFDLFEDVFSSPRSREVMRDIMRVRDSINFQIDIFSTTHDSGAGALDNFTVEEVRVFHETIRHIREQIHRLQITLQRMCDNLVARRNRRNFYQRHMLLDRWFTLCDVLRRGTRQRENMITVDSVDSETEPAA